MTAGRHGMHMPNQEGGEQALSLALGSSTGTDHTYELRFTAVTAAAARAGHHGADGRSTPSTKRR